MKTNNLLQFLILIVIFSCSNVTKVNSTEEYCIWLRDPENGLYNERKIGNLLISAQYHTKVYMAILQANKDDIIPILETIDSLSKNYNTSINFQFKISDVNLKDDFIKSGSVNEEDYQAKLDYLTSKIQEDFYLVSGTDTLECIEAFHERNYGISPIYSFMLSFNAPPKNTDPNDLVLVYNDNLENLGTIMIRFKKEFFINEPVLNL